MIKIETETNSVVTSTNAIMKVLSTVDTTLLCGVLDFSGKKYYVDFEEFNKFAQFDKKFLYVNESDKYPSYLYNYKRYSLLEFLFNYNSSNITYIFKNNDEYDLRKLNVEIVHKYNSVVKEKYKIIEYIQGHYINLGIDAYVMKNPLWRVLNDNDEEELLMYCEKDTLCKLCDESYQKILDYEKINHKKITFYLHQNGYICCAIGLYIHQIITECFGNGKGTKETSVDHIDQNPLNNSLKNLRIATREEQKQNCRGIKEGTKRERNHNAKELPEGIAQDMLLKYVVYYNEWLNPEKTKSREFFKVEKHPKLDKPWITSKSNKISIKEKLASANKIVEDLKNDIYPTTSHDELPKHISIKVERNKPHMIFDKKNEDGTRLNLRMVLPEDYNIQEHLKVFKEKIKTKYDYVVE
jgi:hypothetical protein